MKKKLSIKYKNKNKKPLKNKNRNKNRKSLKNKNKKSLKNRNKNRNKKSRKNKTRNGSTNNLSINKQIGGAEAYFDSEEHAKKILFEKEDKEIQNKLLKLYNSIFPQSTFYNSLINQHIIIPGQDGAHVFNPVLSAENITKLLKQNGDYDLLTDIILEYGDTDYYYVFGHGMECYNRNDDDGANYKDSVSGFKMAQGFTRPTNKETIGYIDEFIGFDFEILFSSLPNQASWMDTNTILHQIFLNRNCTHPISVLAQNDNGPNLIKDCINPQGIKDITELGGVQFSTYAYNLFLTGSDRLVHTYIHLNLMNYYKYGPGKGEGEGEGNVKWDADVMGKISMNVNNSYFQKYFEDSDKAKEIQLMANINILFGIYKEGIFYYEGQHIPEELKNNPQILLQQLGFEDGSEKLNDFKSLVNSTIIQELEGLFNHTHGVYQIVKGGRDKIIEFEPGLNYNLKEICKNIRQYTFNKSIIKQHELFTRALSVASGNTQSGPGQHWKQMVDNEQRIMAVKEKLERSEFSQNKKIRLFVLACRSPYNIVTNANNDQHMNKIVKDLEILLGITPTGEKSLHDPINTNIESVDDIKLPDPDLGELPDLDELPDLG